jgi:predicted exporter
MYWIKGSMSLMAFGICAVVLGVAISYCLHIIIHHRFVGDIEQLLRDESKPVFLGCLTTVGAFMGLLFTKSELLRDFGLFATLALVGSTFFTLVFLPHLLKEGDMRRNTAVLRVVDRINNAPYDRTPWFIGALVLVIAVGLVFSGRVRFDSDLRNIGYESEQFQAAMARYNQENQGGKIQRYYAATGATLDEALQQHKAVRRVIDSLKADGCIGRAQDLVSVLFIPEAEQKARIAAWEAYWTPDKRSEARNAIDRSARRNSLDPALFDPFFSLLDVEFEPASLYGAGVIPEGLLCNFIEHSADRYLVFSPVLLEEEQQAKVDNALAQVALVVDPMFYTGSLVELTHRDFNAALLLSSLFVLLVLLVSFRNVWVALLAFLPMGLSWYVVQGWMAIFGLEFNLLNIVISTFVFGIGVDYSIFVMQGLLAGALGKDDRLLQYHKTAIFFSAFVLLVVILSLLLALHPAIRSIGWCSLIGMGATILITYSLQPLIFRQMLRLPFIRKTILKP